jgi:hypothetical protein
MTETRITFTLTSKPARADFDVKGLIGPDDKSFVAFKETERLRFRSHMTGIRMNERDGAGLYLPGCGCLFGEKKTHEH